MNSVLCLLLVFPTSILGFSSFSLLKSTKLSSLYCTAGTIPVKDAKTGLFLDWATKEGINSEKCSLFQFSGGLRGIGAVEDIDDNFISVSVPADLVIQTNNNRPPSPFPTFCSQNYWAENCKWDHRLALMLLHEVKGFTRASTKKEWIDKLPESYSTPFHWTKEDISEIQYSALEQRIEKQQSDWKTFYNNWVTDSGDSLEVRNISYDEFIWALESVNSRAFSGVYEGSSAEERRSIFLFTGALTLIWPLAGLGSTEQSLGAALLVAISIITKDFFFSRAAGLKRYVICPYIDMFNHKSTCTSDVSYGYFSNSFELKTQGYKRGEQVFISYGKQSNDRLLQYYGFIDPDNPHDIYDFGVGFLELILKYADAIDVTIPVEPSPQERLGQIAAAIQSTSIEDSKSSPIQKGSPSTSDEKSSRYFRIAPLVLETDKFSITSHFDDITVRSMRALYSTPTEWDLLVKESGGGGLQNLNRLGVPLSDSTEKSLVAVLTAIIRLELSEKETSFEEDSQLLRQLQSNVNKNKIDKIDKIDLKKLDNEENKKGFGSSKEKVKSKSKTSLQDKVAIDPSGSYSDLQFTALTFRIEKKKILMEALEIPQSQ